MTRQELIKNLREVKRQLVEEVKPDELSDYAREEAYWDIEDAIEKLKENE